MNIEFKGLDALQKNLDNLSRRAEELDGENNVPISELLSPDFLSQCCKFNSVDDLFEESGFNIESQEDFDTIPDEELDKFINDNTSFDSWQEMLQAAGVAWAKKKLGF